MPNPQPDPRMVQWQMRFDTVQRALSEPRRPGETPQQYDVRRTAAANALRQLQTSKPVPQPAPVARPQGGGGGMLDGLYGYITGHLPGK